MPGRANTTRRPGRPARLSRDAILDAGLELLEREPREPLTLARVAEAVEAVPAALYRHVGSHDELLDGVLGRVLEGLPLGIRRRARWPEQVREWMTCMRNHLLRYPAVLPLIGRRSRTSPAWLDASDVLLEILGRTGLRDGPLARAHLWIQETALGIVMQEASLPLPDQIEAARASLGEISEQARSRLAPLMPHYSRIDADDFFEFVAERTLVALVDFVAAHAARPRR
jgi:AcrR family transcriptional regulator